MDFPEDRKYTKEHEWIKVDGDAVTLGITEFAQQELGDIVFIELPEIGKALSKGDTICVVESTKAASDVYTFVSGTVKEVNQSLSDAPEAVNSSPYEDGWMVKLEGVENSNSDELMNSEQYKEFLGDRV